jgi:hypothetical protein
MENRDIVIQEAVNKIFNIPSDNYIFIYTPPKVGSTTLVSSLRISLLGSFSIIHIHDDIMLGVLTGITNVTVNEIIQFLAQQGRNVYVIDVYRTPIERKMSEFFEKISIYHFNNLEMDMNKYSTKRISDRFNSLFPYLANGEHYFDKYDLENPLPFDFVNNYTLQIHNKVNYIKLRLKDAKNWGNMLSSIFKRDVVIINDYLTNDKSIAEIYNRFKADYKLPLNYYNLIKDCEYMKFYLSDDERNNYLEQYSNRLGPGYTPYTQMEYDFYIRLCLENQFVNDIQGEHYIDEGCICQACKIERAKLFDMLKNGIKTNKRIKHSDSLKKSQSDKSGINLMKCKLKNPVTSRIVKNRAKYGENHDMSHIINTRKL